MQSQNNTQNTIIWPVGQATYNAQCRFVSLIDSVVQNGTTLSDEQLEQYKKDAQTYRQKAVDLVKQHRTRVNENFLIIMDNWAVTQAAQLLLDQRAKKLFSNDPSFYEEDFKRRLKQEISFVTTEIELAWEAIAQQQEADQQEKVVQREAIQRTREAEEQERKEQIFKEDHPVVTNLQDLLVEADTKHGHTVTTLVEKVLETIKTSDDRYIKIVDTLETRLSRDQDHIEREREDMYDLTKEVKIFQKNTLNPPWWQEIAHTGGKALLWMGIILFVILIIVFGSFLLLHLAFPGPTHTTGVSGHVQIATVLTHQVSHTLITMSQKLTH